jgi:hypothetical protein
VCYAMRDEQKSEKDIDDFIFDAEPPDKQESER